ncbi:MAG TPA: UrcA family protein [Steroidobacteraceae bacterium]|jgi:UrcA family protein|nr:UrcA family protein [Steroidobacteraceae bacterium]
MTRLANKMMLLGGFVALAAAGVAAASPTSSDVPSIAVRYSADMLASDSGARALYHRLTVAAEAVCPQPTSSRIPNGTIVECRNEAIAAAVSKIHNQRLAAVHAAATSKSG